MLDRALGTTTGVPGLGPVRDGVHPSSAQLPHARH